MKAKISATTARINFSWDGSAGRPFPLTPALSLGEREDRIQHSFQSGRVRFVVVILLILILSLLLPLAEAFAATNDVSTLLQKGLFEEEVNRNLDAATRAYQAVIAETDKDHQFAATAVFRLAECYRKQGKTNEAAAQYQRIVREFSDQTELVKLSRDYAGTPAEAAHHNPTSIEFAEDAELRRIQAMIKDSPDLINAYDGQVTPLTTAVDRRQLKVVAFLLDNKADTEVRDKRNGQTPLMIATEASEVEMVKLLLDHGADVNAVNGSRDGITPLHYAAYDGFKAVAEILLAHGAQVNAQSGVGRTPLHFAASKGYRTVAEVLLSHGANIEAKDHEGNTPLHVAVNSGNKAIAELLLANKADPNASDKNGTTPLSNASALGNKAIVELLLTNNADVNARNLDELSPLANAALNDRLENARLLLQHGADVNAGSAQRYSHYAPLHFAIDRNNLEMVELLLTNKADANAAINFNNNRPSTRPLSMTILRGYPDGDRIVSALLAYHADPNLADTTGLTPLHWATQMNPEKERETMVKLLLDHGANVNARDEKGQSPIHWAARNNETSVVDLLIAHHADVNLKDNEDNTPLDLRMSQINYASMPLNGLVPNASGTLPLSYQWSKQPGSAVSSHADVTDILREHGGVTELELGTIRYFRKGNNAQPVVFIRRNVALQDGCFLFELLANMYAPAHWNYSSLPGFQFPDLGHLKIHHLSADGRTNSTEVDIESALNAGDCSKDIQLHWGDVVEIPEMDHNVSEHWSGLTQPARDTLKKCLACKVEITVKGHVTRVGLTSHFLFSDSSGAINHPAESTGSPELQLHSYWLRDVVNGANVILSSSDLSRVKVKRRDSATQKPAEARFDLDRGGESANLLLRDGDVIEIHEKPGLD